VTCGHLDCFPSNNGRGLLWICRTCHARLINKPSPPDPDAGTLVWWDSSL
jgi:hypothetical protein